MLFGFLIFVQVAVALAMIFLVLLQGGRGAELGAAFGGMGQSQSSRGPMTGIAKVTAIVAAIFMVSSLSLAYLSTEQATDSVVSGIQAPVIPASESSEKATAESSENAPASTQEKSAETVEQTDAPKLEQTDAPPLPTKTKSNN